MSYFPPPQGAAGYYGGQQQQAPPGLYQSGPPPQQQQQQPMQGYGPNYGNPQQMQAMMMQQQQQQQQQQMMMMQQQQQQQQLGGAGGGGPFGFGNIPVPQQLDPAAQKREDDLRSWFIAVDQKKTGRIDAESLRAALSSSGAEFKASTAERLIRMFDKDATGSIEYNEFKAAHLFIQQMASGFRTRDRDGSGVLEGPEVREALALSGYQLSQPAFELLLRKFGRPTRANASPNAPPPSIDFGSYIDLSIMLGASARVFGFYDRNRSGLVTFDFNTFFVALLASTV